jgi:multicomponent Na+:H+ antiporter subunit D
MLIAMGIASVLCIAIGSYPTMLYSLLPWDNTYVPYDVTHTLTQLQLLFFSALAFVWLNKKGLYPPELKSVNLDVEWLYRTAMPVSGLFILAKLTQLKSASISLGNAILASLPVMKRDSDANAATMTFRMAIGFVVLVILAFVTQFL